MECTVNANIDAYIPEKYVRSSNHRMEAYKKISLIRSQADLYDITDELLDRYGDPPKPVSNLLKISRTRALGSAAQISKIEFKGATVLYYPEVYDLRPWIGLGKKGYSVQVIPGKVPCVSLKVDKSTAVETACEALKLYLKLRDEASGT